MTFPRLYKPTKTGAIQICDISVTGDTVVTVFGQLDGKLQTSTDKCTPKNIGRSNETTAEAQALLEAQSKFDKKKKSGYSETISATPSVQLPQKVKSYPENKHLVEFPCFVTTKLNGVNATYWLNADNSLTLTSRGGETYPAIPHLEPIVRDMFQAFNTTCINGELYIHGESLQNIQSAVKKPKELSKSLTFVAFELPLVQLPFIHKVPVLRKHPSVVPIIQVDEEEHLIEIFESAVSSGFEGVVIYNANAIYKFNERSSSVLKYKPVLDAEYIIRSYNVDRNGHPVFICETPDGQPFKVKPKGTNEERLAIIANFDSMYKDQYYTIEYETLSDTGIPLKPVGIGLRACTATGEPKE